jgi:hypothetical protein
MLYKSLSKSSFRHRTQPCPAWSLMRQELTGRSTALLPDGQFFVGRRERLVSLAARHVVPTICVQRGFTLIGGVIDYGTNLIDAYRQAAVYAGRPLRGAKPRNLQVVQPISKTTLPRIACSTNSGGSMIWPTICN